MQRTYMSFIHIQSILLHAQKAGFAFILLVVRSILLQPLHEYEGYPRTPRTTVHY